MTQDEAARQTAIRDVLVEARRLAVRYLALTGKPLGVTGEIAEWAAAEYLGLTLTGARSPDIDAILGAERFQIKGRAVDAGRRYIGRVPALKVDGDYEHVLLVLLDKASYEPLEIWQTTRLAAAARLAAPGSKARNERKSMAISQFKSIARKVWPPGA